MITSLVGKSRLVYSSQNRNHSERLNCVMMVKINDIIVREIAPRLQTDLY